MPQAFDTFFISTEPDAFFELGYVHAQDRLWQMEMHRRIGAGRLSEIFGEKTLTELKLSILESEIKIKGGASPRIMPMFNIRDIGNLLQQIGYNLTVVDSDLITYQYENFMDLVRALRGMGITNILSKRDKNYLGKKTLEEIGKNYLKKFGNKQNKINATFEILYLTGWSPHYSQQKPLKPGSAEHSLSSILNSKK